MEQTQPVRVPQAQRSALMRARLSKAAFEVIRDQGYVNFRTAAVARRAGVSQGAQLHHYPTKNSLALAAIEYAFEETTTASLAQVASLQAGEEPLRALVDDARAFFFSDHFRVALDILMAGGKEESLKQDLIALTLRHRGRVERAWLEKLIDAGWSLTTAEDLLAMTLSLVRGFAIRGLVEADTGSFERLFDRWLEIVGVFAGDAKFRRAPQ